MALTDKQAEFMAALTLAYPAGFLYRDGCELADELVESGHLVRAEVEGGVAYQLSPEAARAQRALTALQAERAALN